MRRNLRCEPGLLAFSLLQVLLLPGPSALAGTEIKTQQETHSEQGGQGGGVQTAPPPKFSDYGLVLQVKNGASYLELGPEWKVKGKDCPPRSGCLELGLGLRARVPFQDEKEQLALIDRGSNTWKLVGSFDLMRESETPPPSGGDPFSFTLIASARTEWGTEAYQYTPMNETKQSVRTHSLGAELEVRGSFEGRRESAVPGFQIGPQMLLRFAREWEGSEERGVVVPGTGEEPATVRQQVLEGPVEKQEFSARLGVPLYVPWARAFNLGFGPYASYRFGKKSESYQRARGEAWVYYFPSTSVPNTRLGLAAFGDWRTQGADDLRSFEYGLLLQLRLAVTLLEY